MRRIIEGTKQVELRRGGFARDVQQLVFYVTSPVQRILAITDLAGVISEDPSELWENVKTKAGVSEQTYFEYFAGSDTGHALVIDDVTVVRHPVRLIDVMPGLRPPQSFRYLSKQEVRAIESLGDPVPTGHHRAPSPDELFSSSLEESKDFITADAVVHVFKNGTGNWHVSCGRNRKSQTIHRTQKEALHTGRRLARGLGGMLCIHDSEGAVRRRHTYS